MDWEEMLGPLAGAGAGAAGDLASAFLGFQQQKELQAIQHHHDRNMYKFRYRRTMKDMRKAGLNPILAYQQGVGSVPSTAGPSSPRVPELGKHVSTAMGIRRLKQELQNMKAVERRDKSEVLRNEASVDLLRWQEERAWWDALTAKEQYHKILPIEIALADIQRGVLDSQAKREHALGEIFKEYPFIAAIEALLGRSGGLGAGLLGAGAGAYIGKKKFWKESEPRPGTGPAKRKEKLRKARDKRLKKRGY